jgi:hypothetical protein
VKRVVFLVTLVLAGCGGSSAVYSASATQACLTGIGARVSASDADYVAQSAGGGGYLVIVEGRTLNMAFGESVSEGKQLYETYSAVGSSGLLGRSSNVVMVWDDNPPGNVEKMIRGCLRSKS